MKYIKWVFFPKFIEVEILPFLFLIVSLIIVFILSYFFVKIELEKNTENGEELKNEKED